jgi:hypothetical protein
MKTMMDFLVDSMVYALDYSNLKVMLNLDNDNDVIDYIDDFTNWDKLTEDVGDKVYNFVCDNITVNETFIDKSFFEEALGEVDWKTVASRLIDKWLGDNKADYESINW